MGGGGKEEVREGGPMRGLGTDHVISGPMKGLKKFRGQDSNNKKFRHSPR